MKNSISSDDLVCRLSELCENQSVIISGIGKLLNLLSENTGKSLTTLTNDESSSDDIHDHDADPKDETPRRRGRPSKSITSVDKKSKSSKVVEAKEDINSMKFSEVLLHVAKLSKKPMKVAGFVEYALKIGYKSDAKDFANITYQYLHSMFKKGKIQKNENNEYFLD